MLYVIILGAVIALSVVFLPDGALGFVLRRRRTRRQAPGADPAPAVPDLAPSEKEA